MQNIDFNHCTYSFYVGWGILMRSNRYFLLHSYANQWQFHSLKQATSFCSPFLLLITLTLLTSCTEPLQPQAETTNSDNATTTANGVLVMFKDPKNTASRARTLNASGLRETASFGLLPGLSLASVRSGWTLQQTLDTLENNPDVAYAEPDYLFTIKATPNDPRFDQQYALHNIGSNGTADADIDAPEAWDIHTGSEVVVAVIDSGVDYNHPDLRENMWINPNEIANNGVDDDGNGFIDDIRGWNFVNNNNNPMDTNDHGTHVAGIIAASGNNGTGVVGVNWTARIMALKFIDAKGVGTSSGAIRAIEYAATNGARISNNSWGGGAFSQALFDAISAANNRGHVFVTAAGNDSANNDTQGSYPANYDLPNIISVAATNNNDRLASFSNFGASSVHIAAPGATILSTVRNNAYSAKSGTSMAAPFVAGVGALILSQNPDLLVSDIRNAILTGADPLTSLRGRVANGRLNAFNALNNVTPAQPVVNITPGTAEVPVGLQQTFSASSGTAPYSWTVSDPAIAQIDTTTGVLDALTIGTVEIQATDADGITSDPIVVAVTAMSITPPDTTQISLNDTPTFSILGGTAPYQWEISDPTVADITISGANQQRARINPLIEGVFDLSITDSAAPANVATIKSIQVAIIPLAVSQPSSDIVVGDTLQLTPTTGNPPYTWSSSDNAIASVDETGLVSAISAGTAIITIADTTTTIDVTINASDPLPISLTVTPADSTIDLNQRLQLQVSETGEISWSSADDTVARVTQLGLVVPQGPGTVTITATDTAGNQGNTTVTINPPANNDDDDD